MDKQHKDGVSDVKGGGQSAGGRWPGNQDAPAHPNKDVVTHVLTEDAEARDSDKPRK